MIKQKSEDVIYLCRRCGRKLRNPQAQARGMGYVCYQKYLKEDFTNKLFHMKSLQTSQSGL